MQRTDPDGIVLLCDFCRRDWDGVEPMIEGHHGSILCLECLKLALRDQVQTPGEGPAWTDGKFKCTLCLRFNMPASLAHWSNPNHPDAIVCQECIIQAAKAFSRNKEVPWTWETAPTPNTPPASPSAPPQSTPSTTAMTPAKT